MVWERLKGWVESDGVERGKSARPQAEFFGVVAGGGGERGWFNANRAVSFAQYEHSLLRRNTNDNSLL